MKQPQDTQTTDAFQKDVFDLTHTDDWPFPEPITWPVKTEPTLREWLTGLLKK